MKRHTLHKEERLCKKDDIADLFEKGRSFRNKMFHVFYRLKKTDQVVLPRIVISASKKKFKRAVERNNIKRKVREAYRLNKHIITNELAKRSLDIDFILIYSEKANTCFSTIEAKIILTLYRLKKEIEKYEFKENL